MPANFVALDHAILDQKGLSEVASSIADIVVGA